MKVDAYKFKVANDVVRAVRAHKPREGQKAPVGGYALYAYSNGREQGYTMYNFDTDRAVTFAENRNSDDVVVYVWTEWNMYDGGGLIDSVYETRRYFPPEYAEAGSLAKVADYIVNWLSQPKVQR